MIETHLSISMMKSKMYRSLVLVAVLCAAAFVGCSQGVKDDYLVLVYASGQGEIGDSSGYMNIAGDTVIPIGKYFYCYTDTLRNFAIVHTRGGKCIAIDRDDQMLFEVYWYDNGPDYVSDGLFRIIEGEKIGYADTDGKVVIVPQYDCAYPYQDGQAKVSKDCTIVPMGEYLTWESENWMYIDLSGKVVE